MRRRRAASRRGSTTARPTRFRARRQIWPRSAVRRPRPKHKSPAAAAGPPAVRVSGEEQFPLPSFAIANKQQPIMQPKRSLLPELDARRQDPKAGPVNRPRHRRFAKSARIVVDALFELGAARQRLRLIRGPGADLAVARPAGKIGVSVLVG